MNNYQLITDYYIAHRDELLAFVGSRLGGIRQEAEDIVQDVFLRLLTGSKLITAITLPALVYTITRNLISDHYRRRTSSDAYEHYLKNNAETDCSAESVLGIREITEQLERGLAHVPADCREVYRMHVYGGMKVSEISRRLGEGYKHIEYSLGIARRAARQALVRYA